MSEGKKQLKSTMKWKKRKMSVRSVRNICTLPYRIVFIIFCIEFFGVFGKFLSKNHNKSMMPSEQNVFPFSCVYLYALSCNSVETIHCLFSCMILSVVCKPKYIYMCVIWNWPITLCVQICLLYVYVICFICMFILFLNPHLKNQVGILQKTKQYTRFYNTRHVFTSFLSFDYVSIPLLSLVQEDRGRGFSLVVGTEKAAASCHRK